MYKQLLAAVALLAVVGLAGGCGDDVKSSLGQTGTGWLIPVDEVIDGGPGKDGIPSIDQPHFFGATQVAFVHDTDLVVGVKIGNDVRAYPELILDYHEIVNDVVGGQPISVTYCPLTGSALVWDAMVAGRQTTFGVSGLLYNTNLMPYDRLTNSTWSQMKEQCVNGNAIGKVPDGITAVETTWKTWREAYPDTKVLGRPTFVSRPYGHYPYGDYRSNHNLLLAPINNEDGRLPRKVRVLGLVVDNRSKAYPLSTFGAGVLVINDMVNDQPVVAVGSSSDNFAVVFRRATESAPDSVLTFEAVQGQLPIVMVDSDSSHYDWFGTAVDGPRAGQQLIATDSYISMWFAWATFHRGPWIQGQ